MIGCHPLLDWEGVMEVGSRAFQLSIGRASQSVLTGDELLLSIGASTGVSAMIV